jgi:hypothetical protein
MKREAKSMQETLACTVCREKCSDGQLKVTIKLCTIGEREQDGKRYPYSPEVVDGLTIRDLGYVCYWSDYEGGHLMLGDLAYTDCHTTLDERKLDAMLKSISAVNRKLAKVRERIGHARTADEQVMHLALALGIATVFVYDPERRHDREWVCTDVANGRGAIVEWTAAEQTRHSERRTTGGM